MERADQTTSIQELQRSSSDVLMTRSGQIVPECAYAHWRTIMLHSELQDGLTPLQVAEGCGFSLAMVARFALGHSADKGTVTAFAGDSLFGYVVLAAARHLLNSGATVRIVIPHRPEQFSPLFTQLLVPLDNRGAQLLGWDAPEWGELREVVESSHNVLCGICDTENVAQSYKNIFTQEMNESRVPVHCVGVPLGAAQLISEQSSIEQLYASSTLSLGLPIQVTSAMRELFGRHYLADAGWSLRDYRQFGLNGASLFSEQPVVQLLQNPENS